MFSILLSTFLWSSFINEDTIKIAVTAGKEVEDAVSLAIDGTNIQQINFDDDGYVAKGIMNAEKAIEQDVLAVIGHKESYISIPASSLYEFNKTLMISPSSTSLDLTNSNYKYIFRAIPNDREISQSLVNYCKSKGFNKTLICYADNSYGKSFAKSFESEASKERIDIVDRVSYLVGDEREFSKIVKKWENFSFDSIFFIGYVDEGITFMNSNKFNVPVILSESFGSKDLIEKLGDRDISVPFLYNPIDKNILDFENSYYKQFGYYPSFDSVIAYDAVNILKQAIDKVGSDSYDVAEYLKDMPQYSGLANSYSFDDRGEVKLKNIWIYEVAESKNMGTF